MILPIWLLEYSEFIKVIFELNEEKILMIDDNKFIEVPIFYLEKSPLWNAFTIDGINGDVLVKCSYYDIDNILMFLNIKDDKKMFQNKLYPLKEYNKENDFNIYCKNKLKLDYICKFNINTLINAINNDDIKWTSFMLNWFIDNDIKIKIKYNSISNKKYIIYNLLNLIIKNNNIDLLERIYKKSIINIYDYLIFNFPDEILLKLPLFKNNYLDILNDLMDNKNNLLLKGLRNFIANIYIILNQNIINLNILYLILDVYNTKIEELFSSEYLHLIYSLINVICLDLNLNEKNKIDVYNVFNNYFIGI